MSLQYALRGANTAMRMRKQMKKTGKTPKGDWIWTREEDHQVIHLYPNYKLLKKNLRRRTCAAIQARAGRLGITKKYRRWTAAEVSKLRRMYPAASRGDILAAFPDMHWRPIARQAYYCKLRRNRRPYKKAGFEPIDDILHFSFKNNLSLVDIDKMARTKKYFQSRQWSSNGFTGHKAVLRAALALGGQINITWEEMAG